MSDEAPSAPPKRASAPPVSRVRRALRWLARLVGGTVAVIVLLIAFAHTSRGQAWIRGVIEQRVSARMNGSITIKQLSFALLGEIETNGVVLKDDLGVDAIAIDHVLIRPSWGDLFHGVASIDLVEIKGVRVLVDRHEDGSSNLSKLFKSKPPPTTAGPPAAPSKPVSRVRVGALIISGVNVDLHRPDGLDVHLRDAGMMGDVDASPASHSAQVSLRDLSFHVDLARPDGLAVSIRDFHTSATAAVRDGSGPVRIGTTTAHASLTLPGATTARETDLNLGAIGVDVSPAKIHALWESISAAALAVDAIEATALTVATAPGQIPDGEIRGVKLDPSKLNAAIGKELLAAPVELRASAHGSESALGVDATIDTAGARLVLASTSDVSSTRRSTRMTLSLTDLDTTKLLIAGSTQAPPTTLKTLKITASGSGETRDDLSGDVELDASALEIGTTPIESVRAVAHLERGEVQIKSLVVKLYGQEIDVTGTYGIEGKTLKADVASSGVLQELLTALRSRGVAIPPVAQALRIEPGHKAHIEGKIGGDISVDLPAVKLGVASGAVVMDAHLDLTPGDPAKTEKKVVVKSMRANASLRSIPIHQLATLSGKDLHGAQATASGQLHIAGTPEQPDVRFEVAVDAGPSSSESNLARIELKGNASKSSVTSTLKLTQRGVAEPLATGAISLPVFVEKTRRGLSPNSPLEIDLDVPSRALRDLAALLPAETREGKTIPNANVALSLHLRGTASHPTGTFAATVSGALVSAFEGTQTVSTKASLEPNANGVELVLDTDLLAGSDKPLLKSRTTLTLASSPLISRPDDLRWAFDGDIAPRKISELPLPRESVAGLNGSIGAHVNASGTLRDVEATIALDADGVSRGSNPPIDAHVAAKLSPTTTTISVETTAAKIKIAQLSGTVGVAGTGLLRALKERTLSVPDLALRLAIVDHTLDDLSPLRPAWKGLQGTLGGAIDITGKATSPHFVGDVGLREYPTVAGGKATGKIHLDGALSRLAIEAQIASTAPNATPIVLKIDTRPEQLLGKGGALGDLDVNVSLGATAVNVASVMPATEKLTADLDAAGTLDAAVLGSVGLRITPLGRSIRRGSFEGAIALADGAFTLPHTHRRIKGVRLGLVARPDEIELIGLEAHESDLGNSDRTLQMRGKLALSALQPSEFSTTIRAKDWLVHGTPALGPTDAPRGELNAELMASGDLSSSLKKVRVDVGALELIAPDRFLRSHSQEQVSTGDVVFVDDASKIGRLVRSVVDAPQAASPEPPAPSVAGAPSGYEIDVLIPKPIHIKQIPINLYLQGDVHIASRDGSTTSSGKLKAVSGDLLLGGRHHELQRGEIRFEASGPPTLDLEFARAPLAAAQRDYALTSSKDAEVRIHLIGPYGKQRVDIYGASDSLFDTLFVNNAGRPRWTSAPNLPASQSLQVPQFSQARQITFLTVNLPHLLFLDRVRVVAHPNESLTSYGNLEHMEGERYSSDGSRRVRIASRPPTAGQSDAEIEYDLLLKNDKRVISGFGVVGGTRGGGGPSVFFEWSSRD